MSNITKTSTSNTGYAWQEKQGTLDLNLSGNIGGNLYLEEAASIDSLDPALQKLLRGEEL